MIQRRNVWYWVRLFAFYVAFTGVSALSVQAADPWDGVEVDRIEDNLVYFKAPAGKSAPKPLKTQLKDLKFWDILRAEGIPYLLFTGRPCTDCLQDKAVYLYRMDGARSTHFVFPGKIIDPKKQQLVFESRAFYGKCLPEPGDAYVVFQKERVDRKAQLQASVFVAKPGADILEEKLHERRLPNIKNVLARVKGKQCKEIDGRNRMMLSKPLDLTPRRGNESDDDRETDEAPKENQTEEDLPSTTEE